MPSSETVRMFDRIADRYDRLNRWISLGQDRRWRRRAVQRLAPVRDERVLDLGTGTGDLALEAARQAPGVRVFGVDASAAMLSLAMRRDQAQAVRWVIADAERLPFAAGAFDGLISGYLLRNLRELERGLAEQLRVLRPGGRWVALDTTRPPRNLLRPLIELHLRVVIPLLGRLLAGDAPAYRYLSESTRSFLSAEALAEKLRAAGLRDVGFDRLGAGAVAEHRGVRPPA